MFSGINYDQTDRGNGRGIGIDVAPALSRQVHGRNGNGERGLLRSSDIPPVTNTMWFPKIHVQKFTFCGNGVKIFLTKGVLSHQYQLRVGLLLLDNLILTYFPKILFLCQNILK